MADFFEDDELASDLSLILRDPRTDKKTRSLARQVSSMERKVKKAGLDPSLTEPRESLFMQILDTLDAPRQGVAGVVDAALRGDIFTPEVGTGWRRGQIENTTASDIFRRHDIIDNPIARGVVGFATDVLTDPLSWVSLGTGAGAKIAGRAVTETGLAASNKIVQRLADEGADLLSHAGREAVDNKVNEIFRAAAKWDIHNKALKKATNASEMELELSQMEKFQSILKDYIDAPDLVSGALFEKPKLSASLNVPFLGHIIDGPAAQTKEVLMSDPGIVGQALRSIGNVIKPGKVKLGEINLTDEFVDSLDNIRMYANEKMAKTLGAISALEPVPVLGAGVRGAKKVGSVATDSLATINKTFKKIFNRKALIGADANSAVLDFIDAKAAAREMASERVVKALGPDILRNKPLQKEAVLAIDSLAMNAAKTSIAENPELVKVINKIRLSGDVTDADRLAFKEALASSEAEGAFRQGLGNLMADPSIPPELKDTISRTVQVFDDMFLEEAASGLQGGYLEYYIPHKYLAMDSGVRDTLRGAAKPGAFLKERKYQSLSEAFSDGGRVGDTDLASLMQFRIEKSLNLQAQRRFFQRLAVEEGLPEEIVSNMYKEAALNPGGAAARALKRYRINVTPIDKDLLAEGEYIKARQAMFASLGKDPEVGRVIYENASDFQQKLHEDLWTAGVKPLDYKLPQTALGEAGELVEAPGGGYKAFLPKPIADAYKETIASRDILRESLGGSQIGQASLRLMDHASNWFKDIVTKPWPAYWALNFMGDRFRQAMQGIHAVDPGIFARTHDVLVGKSAIKSLNGMTLTSDALKRIAQRAGIKMSANDYLGTIESFADMNIEKFLAKKNNSLAKNIMKGKPLVPGIGDKAAAAAALEQLHDKTQFAFDGFFRLSHFVHRFEKGDSIQDALRAASDIYFNYKDLTPVEQSFFRRFYMFYGYMSKATKSTLTDLVSNPGNITMQLHGVNALAEMFSDPDAAPTADEYDSKLLRSAAANEQLSRIIGKTPEGKPIIGRGFAAPLNAIMQQFSVQSPKRLSVDSIIDAAGDSAIRTIQKQFATANPIINSAAQIVSGKNLYFNKPISAEFLRKLPSLNAAAEKIAGYKYDELPIDLDAATKLFLKAVPDGKGRLIADPKRMWILTNMIPGFSRLVSTTGTLTNTDIPTGPGLARAFLGINIDDADPSRSYLYSRRNELSEFINENSVNQRLANR